MIIPLVLAGSLFTLIPNIYGLTDLLAPIAPAFQLANDITFGLITVYLAISFSHYLAGSYKINEVIVPILAVVCLFLTTAQIVVVDGANLYPMQYLGTWGMFGGLSMALYVVEFYRLLYKWGVYIKSPKGVPEGIGKFIESMVPAFVIILPIWFLSIQGIYLSQLIGNLMSPLFQASDTFWAILLAGFLENLTWFIGVHSWAGIGPAYFPFLISNGVANAEAYAAGEPMPYTNTISTYFGASAGGTGNHLALAIFGLFSKSKTIKTVARAGIIPCIFGINEPILFGYPVILNPVYFIPHVLIAPIFKTLPWVVITLGWVQKASVPFLGFVPPGFIWFLGTPNDWRSLPWGIFGGLILPAIFYYPFFKLNEKQRLAEEAAGIVK
jgi:PTS system cellobiose-specific IIC component